jgi:hypothetical protein
MIRFSVAVFAAFSMLACGGAPLTPQTACEEQIDAQCEKMWTCPSPGVKVGNDLDSCKTQYKGLCALSASGCASGKTFDATNAAACNPALKAQSCDEFKTSAPESCKNQCK